MISFNKEQIYIVTGASSGIGEGTALLLNELGATVIGIARNEERLKAMKAKCKYPENMFLEIKDLTEDIENLPQYVKELKNKYGKFSGMAYCAGICEVKPLQLIDYNEMKYLFDIDYFAPIFMAKGFVDRRNNIGKGASIVFISSMGRHLCDRGMTTYAGAKNALSASVKVISREVVGSGVRVNSVSPSNVATAMSENKELEKLYPLGFAKVEDIANYVIFLLSDKTSWITSQDYTLDCGYM